MTDEPTGGPAGTRSRRTLFEGDHPDRRHWTLALAAGTASYLDSSIIVGLGVGLALFRDEYGLSEWGVGALAATLTFAIGVGALLGGRIADLLGRMRSFTTYILIYAVGTAVVALSPSEVFLFTGVVIGGLAAGADLPTSLAVVSERAPQRAQGRLLAVTQLLWVVGIGVTTALGFALSGLGVLGIRIIFAELAVVALATYLVRRFSPALRSLESDADEARVRISGDRRDAHAIPLREILTDRSMLVPLVLTMGFYVFWNLVANTFGQFQTYFFVTAGGADQATATGIGTALIPVGVITSLVVIRFIDTRWRTPLFVVGMAVQAAAMVLAGLGGGALLIYVIAVAAYSFGNNAAGEAVYKAWTQESLPVEARSTVQGVTLAAGRFAVGLFALVTPPLLAASPRGLLFGLLGCVLVASVFGGLLVRHLAAQGVEPGDRPEEAVPARPVA